ncbi:MAG: GDP-mannose 4,6-dehydratase [Ktedonobacterales bacterium]|nr:GDP-mannose 4,6-dehydratase [Ktedonobacterales bacterium]
MTRESTSILITGYTGFVAPHLAAACARRYPRARLFGLTHHAVPRPAAPERPPAGVALMPGAVTEVAGAITDGARWREVLRETRPDVIFHLAAVSSVAASWRDPAHVLEVNAGGFIQLAEAVRLEGVAPRIVVVGSGEQYGLARPEEMPITEDTLPRPANPYAVSKVAQDLYAFQYYRAYGLDTVRARPFNHFGPGQSADFVIASFARQIATMETGEVPPVLLVGNLSAQRDFLPVADVTLAYLALAERGVAGEAYNIASGVARSIESILHTLLSLTSIQVEIRVDPARLRPVEVPVLRADTTRLQRDTGWQPTVSLEEALRATLDYWRHVVQVRAAP